MFASAQALRLHILLEPPDIVWVFDRLRVVGLVPEWSFFRSRDAHRGYLVVQLRAVDDTLAQFLVVRLRQIPIVLAVKSKRRKSNVWVESHEAGSAVGD